MQEAGEEKAVVMNADTPDGPDVAGEAEQAAPATPANQVDRLPFEITVPGVWLDLSDPHDPEQIGAQLDGAVQAFEEAATALILFDTATRLLGQRTSRQAWLADGARRQELYQQAIAGLAPEDRFDEQKDQLRHDTIRRTMLREDFAKGSLPSGLAHRYVAIAGKAFVSAADMIGKHLREVARINSVEVSTESKAACEAFYGAFPSLRLVRNSVQHAEQRIRQESARGRKIDVQPIHNRAIETDDQVIVMNSRIGDDFVTTTEDGELGRLEISVQSLIRMRELLETALRTFKWTGGASRRP